MSRPGRARIADFINAANLELYNGLTVDATNITNQSGAIIASGGTSGGNPGAVTRLNAGGALSNSGTIAGPTVLLTASALNNTGTVLGENVGINASTINNGFDPGSSNLTDGYGQGNITATNQLNAITQTLTNTDATIQSFGTLTIAGNASGGNASLVDNRSGLIQTAGGNGAADNSLTIDANTITNERRVVIPASTTNASTSYSNPPGYSTTNDSTGTSSSRSLTA